MSYILIIGLIVLAGFLIGFYNGVIRIRNRSEEAWADIDTQLKRRYDLIPNLVETVKGYAKHEKGTFENVTKARNMAMGAEGMADKAQAENMLTSTLKTLFAVSENYPELKANTNFMDLQRTMTAIEEKIQLARRYFNGTVKEFNTKIEVFPGNVMAKIFSFLKKEYFEIDEEEQQNVKVSFADEAPKAAPKKKAPAKKKTK